LAAQALHILVVEDNAVNRMVARRALERRGHTVVAVEDGAAAVAKVQECAFDVVLMDIQMPIMDGYQATAAIRAGEALSGQHLPILAVTANAMKEDRAKCLEAGMDEYLSKPVEPAVLVATVERLGGALSAGPGLRDVFTASDEAPVLLNRAALMDRLSGDTDVLKEVIDIFFEDMPVQIERLHGALASGSSEEIGSVAHRLKGSLAAMGAEVAAESARALEACARSGELSFAASLADAVEEQVERLEPELAALVDPDFFEPPRGGRSFELVPHGR
jgi:two-component system, sensor histidine kinase and response regulator